MIAPRCAVGDSGSSRLTRGCIAHIVTPKLVTSHPASARSSNSDDMISLVARTREVSALAKKTPMVMPDQCQIKSHKLISRKCTTYTEPKETEGMIIPKSNSGIVASKL